MIKWIIGLNGSGKTVYLEKLLDKQFDNCSKIITNIRQTHYSGFNADRLELLKQYDFYDILTDYDEIEVINNRLAIKRDDFEFTDYFLDVITLLCRNGDTLILDEPEYGLYGMEINFLCDILEVLVDTYKKGYIATHCQQLFGINPDSFYWCNDYSLRKLKEQDLYGYIGQF